MKKDEEEESEKDDDMPIVVPDSYWRRSKTIESASSSAEEIGNKEEEKNALEQAQKTVVYLKTVPVFDAIISAIEHESKNGGESAKKPLNIAVVSSHAAMLHELSLILRLYNATSTQHRIHVIQRPNF